jgi:hypothetical protein
MGSNRFEPVDLILFNTGTFEDINGQRLLSRI